jgi:hypothetical protein
MCHFWQNVGGKKWLVIEGPYLCCQPFEARAYVNNI